MTTETAIAREKLEDIAFELAPIGIVLSEERVIRACNRTFAKLFGYEKSELIGQSFRMLYASHAEFEQVREVGFAVLKAGRPYSDERLMPRRDGSLFWCRVRARSLFPEAPLRRVILTFGDLYDIRPMISLTPRERQVVQYLAKGLTSKEIGRILAISPRTVEEHRAHLLAKFEVSNVAGLLARLGGFIDHAI